ncbi:MAG TPA: hypothetical protein VFV43_13880 [Limnobacter sp.]|nr:hypothetical protein [Limnobacter sp.]
MLKRVKCQRFNVDILQPLLDLDEALPRLGGNSDVLMTLLARFIDEFRANEIYLARKINLREFDLARPLVHRLMHLSSNLAFSELTQEAWRCELCFKENKPHTALQAWTAMCMLVNLLEERYALAYEWPWP